MPRKNLHNYLVLDNGCWEWQGYKDKDGYGKVRNGGNAQPAHLVFYELKYGPVPAPLVLDHVVCNNPSCCNPDHVKPVRQVENVRRGRNTKITVEVARHIKYSGLPTRELVDLYSLNRMHVNDIKTGRRWRDI